MSDGISEARRQERACEALEKALDALEYALTDLHDAAFGVPRWAIVEINGALEPFGLRATQAPGATTPEKR